VDLGSNALTCGTVTASEEIIQDVASATTSDKQLLLKLAGVDKAWYQHKYDAVIQLPALAVGATVIGSSSNNNGYVGRIGSSTAFALLNGGGSAIASTQYWGWGSTTDAMRHPNSSWPDLRLFRQAAGVLSVGTTSNNASGSILCGDLTSSGTITTRNGITPVPVDIFGTYTSDTSFEKLRIGYSSADSGYLISQEIGSAGGTARDIKIGHRNAAGTFAAGITVGTNGETTIIPPTTDPGIAGALWNDGGTLAISAG
jgi:hypothetical protein